MSTSSIGLLLGLQGPSAVQSPPSYGAFYLIFHFLFAYGGISSRPWKMAYGIDHMESPRQDLVKYGAAAVSSGKITQKQLDQMKRVEGAHANSVEHFTLFTAAMVFAHVAHVRPEVINLAGLAYTLARLFYAMIYVFVDSPRLSILRGAAWWTSNIICLRLIWRAGAQWNHELLSR